jgi:hypothetical protein
VRKRFVFFGLVGALALLSGLFAATSLSRAQGAASPRDAKPTTQLTLVALNTNVGRAVFHLDCGPAGGDLPNPTRASEAIAASPQLITNPKPFTCLGNPRIWWDVTITGRLNGQLIRRAVTTCWPPKMATLGQLGVSWNVLQAHLVPRRRESVPAGTKRTFPSGVLRPSDLVTCNIRGHHLELGVPKVTERPTFTGFGGKKHDYVSLGVTRHADGSVTAACLIVR